jgi:hypothetical protein
MVVASIHTGLEIFPAPGYGGAQLVVGSSFGSPPMLRKTYIETGESTWFKRLLPVLRFLNQATIKKLSRYFVQGGQS